MKVIRAQGRTKALIISSHSSPSSNSSTTSNRKDGKKCIERMPPKKKVQAHTRVFTRARSKNTSTKQAFDQISFGLGREKEGRERREQKNAEKKVLWMFRRSLCLFLSLGNRRRSQRNLRSCFGSAEMIRSGRFPIVSPRFVILGQRRSAGMCSVLNELRCLSS